MIKLIKNIVLFAVALILGASIIPLGFIFTTVKLLVTKPLKTIDVLSSIFFNMAKSIDQLGNCSCYFLLNALLIQDDYLYPFGNEDETISSVLGKNKIVNNLTNTGKLLDWILSIFEKNHSIKSIGE